MNKLPLSICLSIFSFSISSGTEASRSSNFLPSVTHINLQFSGIAHTGLYLPIGGPDHLTVGIGGYRL